MSARVLFGACALALLFACVTASGQTTSPALNVHVVAEVEARVSEHGLQVMKLVPADKVVPGDVVFYTLEVRNDGPSSIEAPTVVQAVPDHTTFVANTASGPGAAVSYSVDGGRSFAHAENLNVQSAGKSRRAVSADYTHICWQLKGLLKSGSMAYLRFRARVK
jgi:uncharacterized repeat protein (TIGR01451 family)